MFYDEQLEMLEISPVDNQTDMGTRSTFVTLSDTILSTTYKFMVTIMPRPIVFQPPTLNFSFKTDQENSNFA